MGGSESLHNHTSVAIGGVGGLVRILFEGGGGGSEPCPARSSPGGRGRCSRSRGSGGSESSAQSPVMGAGVGGWRNVWGRVRTRVHVGVRNLGGEPGGGGFAKAEESEILPVVVRDGERERGDSCAYERRHASLGTPGQLPDQAPAIALAGSF